MRNTTGNDKNRQTLRRILRYIRPYWPLVILSLLLSALTVGLTLYVPILTGRGVDYIIGKDQVDFTGLLAVIKMFIRDSSPPGSDPAGPQPRKKTGSRLRSGLHSPAFEAACGDRNT